MKLLTKSQSFDNIIRDTEEQIEKAITDYLNDMTVDDLEKVVKKAEGMQFKFPDSDSYELSGITKTRNRLWFHCVSGFWSIIDCDFQIDQFNLQDKRQLLKLIEETI